MRLRSGKYVSCNFDMKINHILIDLTFDIMLLSNKKITGQVIENSIISICDLLHCIFKINFLSSYPEEKMSDVMDYRNSSFISKNKKYNNKHFKNILNICEIFEEKINNEINILKNNFKNSEKFVRIFSFVFYYFQMIFVESLYQELLEWGDIRYFTSKYVFNNKNFKKHILFDVNLFLTKISQFTNKVVADDNDNFSFVRRSIIKMF